MARDLTTGPSLKKWRLSKGISQVNLARTLGVNQPDISRWENSIRLPASAKQKLKHRNKSNSAKEKRRTAKLVKPKKRPSSSRKKQKLFSSKNNKRVRKLAKSKKREDVKSLRRRLGLNQAEMARLLGTHQPLISHIERGLIKLPKGMSQKIARLGKSKKAIKRRARSIRGSGARSNTTGKQLRAIRLKLGLTQTELGAKVGSHQSRISAEEGSPWISRGLETKILALRKKKQAPKRRSRTKPTLQQHHYHRRKSAPRKRHYR
jgi:transcriptional regulator with XRE-family HTH domain